MKTFQKIIIYCVAIFLSFASKAQTYTIEADILLSAPYPTNLDAYLDNLELGVIQLSNLASVDQEVYFSFSFEETSGAISLSSDGILNDPITLAPGVTILTPQQVRDIFSDFTSDNLTVSGLTQEEQNAILLNRQIPEGEYRICLKAFDQNGITLSDPSLGCIFFDVFYGERPIIFTPYDGAVFGENEFISWDHNVNDFLSQARLEYTVKVIDLTAESVDNIQLAMLNDATPSVYNETFTNLFSTQFFNNIDVFLEHEHEYAIRVSVSDPENQLAFQFGGHSEINVFTYEDVRIEEIDLAAPIILNTDAESSFAIDDKVIINWEHQSDNAKGNLNYSAVIIACNPDSICFTLDSVELYLDSIIHISDINIYDDAVFEKYLWEEEGVQTSIILDNNDVSWEVGKNYQIIIRAVSDSEEDVILNQGFSQVFNFKITEGGKLPAPELIYPINSFKIDSIITLSWKHAYDTIDFSGVRKTLLYELKILDLTKVQKTNISSYDFNVADATQVVSVPLTKPKDANTQTAEIKLPSIHAFSYGNTFAISVVVKSSSLNYDIPTSGIFSNIRKITKLPATAEPDTIPLPFLTFPVDHSTRNDSTIHIVWDHALDDVKHTGWADSSFYKIQIIDLTEKGIQVPTKEDFTGDLFIDKSIIAKDTLLQTVRPDTLIEDHKYAVAIKAQGTEVKKYGNDGYGPIVVFTKSEKSSLPVILSPEDGLFTMNDTVKLKWVHGIDTERYDSMTVINATEYRFKMLDLTGQNCEATIENFVFKQKLMDTIITDRNIDFLPDSMVFNHKYAIVVQAISKDIDKITYTNNGYGNIVIINKGLEQLDGCPGTNCIAALPTDMTSVEITNSNTTEILKMNNLDFKITRIESGNMNFGYNGTAEITIGFLGAGTKIKVSFSGLKRNAAGEIFSGTAEAVYDTGYTSVDEVVEIVAGKAKVDHKLAKGISTSLRSVGKLTSALSGMVAVSLPLGLDRIEGQDTTVIGIAKMSFTPKKNEMMALFSLDIPEWGDQLPSFAADKICFDNEGLAPQVRLFLSEDYIVPIDLPMGKIIFEAADNESTGTYIEINCNGFKEAGLSMSLALNRDLVEPVDDENEVIKNLDVKAKITVSGIVQDTKNWMLGANCTPFQVTKLPGYVFTFKQGWWDSSAKKMIDGMTFPTGYLPEDAGKNWKGFYFKEMSLVFPENFAGGSEDERLKIGLNNFIWDDTGLSLAATGENILSVEKGSVGGCTFSMDLFKIDIFRTQIRHISLDGRLGLPVFEQGDYFNYKGLIDLSERNEQDDKTQKNPPALSLTIKPTAEPYNIPSIRSSIEFATTSNITIKIDTSGRGVDATLHGYVVLGEGDAEQDQKAYQMLAFPSLRFQNLGINTVKKKGDTTKKTAKDIFKKPIFSLAGIPKAIHKDDSVKVDSILVPKKPIVITPKANGFDFGLDVVSLEPLDDGVNDKILRLTVGGHVAIVNAGKAFELGAEAEISIDCILDDTNGKYSLMYNDLAAADLSIDSQLGPTDIEGTVSWYNDDPTFGDGVLGELAIKTAGIKVDVAGRFGVTSQDTTTYLYLFANYLNTRVGIPIGNSGMAIHGAGGGFYINMKDVEPTSMDPKIKYVPQKKSFGFKFDLHMAYTKPELLSGSLGFGLQINLAHGGFEFIELKGNLDMFQKRPFVYETGTNFSGIRFISNLRVYPPNANRTYTQIKGEFLALANIGKRLMVGNMDNAKDSFTVVDGNLDIITGPDASFELNFGRIHNKGSLKFELPSLGQGIEAKIEGKFYLQASAGKEIEFDDFQVPPFIRSILERGQEQDFTSSFGDPKKKLGKNYGSGLAMGAGLLVDVDVDVDVAFLYANFDAELGFDVSLRPDSLVSCSNRTEPSFGMGNEQYYAKGQIYGGVDGRVGLDVDCFLYQGKIDLFHLYGAFLLQGGFPNPIYAYSDFRLGFSALGGLVTGDVSVPIRIGEKCDTKDEDIYPLAGVTFIEQIIPGGDQVSPFVKPQVSFSNELKVYTAISKSGEELEFDVRLTRFDLKKGNEIVASLERSEMAWDNKSSYLNPASVLEEEMEYTVLVELQVLRDGVAQATETKSIKFTTGKMPKNLVWENITDCYPFRDEINYMIDNNEYNQGLIKLDKSQSDLFEKYEPANQKWHSKIVARVYSKTLPFMNFGSPTYAFIGSSEANYDASNNIIYYDFVPRNALQTQSHYELRIERIWYENPNFNISSNTLSNEVVSNSSSSVTYTKQGKTYSNADEQKPAGKVLGSYGFRTSKFRKFEDKILNHSKAISMSSNQENRNWYTRDYKLEIYNGEAFSEQEVGTRSIDESRTVNKNCAFVQENRLTLTGNYFYDWFMSAYSVAQQVGYPVQDVVLTLPSMFDLDYSNIAGMTFDFDDQRARAIYSQSGISKTNINSKLNSYYPSLEDYRKFDHLMYTLVGWDSNQYKHRFKDLHYSVFKEFEQFWWDTMDAGHWENWTYHAGSQSWAVDHRLEATYKYMYQEAYKEHDEHKVTFTYTIPVLENGNFYHKTVAQPQVSFFKPYK